MALEVSLNKEKYIFAIMICFGLNILHKSLKSALVGREFGAKQKIRCFPAVYTNATLTENF
jgi:hypothetical protein